MLLFSGKAYLFNLKSLKLAKKENKQLKKEDQSYAGLSRYSFDGVWKAHNLFLLAAANRLRNMAALHLTQKLLTCLDYELSRPNEFLSSYNLHSFHIFFHNARISHL